MRKFRSSLVLFTILAIASGLPLLAQQKRVSPHETISTTLGNGGPRVTITYGRPYSKDPMTGAKRKVWGTLVPYGKVWRMGSDEATTFITQVDLSFGEVSVPAGAYTLCMQPEENGNAKLIINKQIGQWGIPYTPAIEKNELARIDLKKDTLPNDVDQFTMAVESSVGGSGATIKMMWETTQYSISFNKI